MTADKTLEKRKQVKTEMSTLFHTKKQRNVWYAAISLSVLHTEVRVVNQTLMLTKRSCTTRENNS